MGPGCKGLSHGYGPAMDKQAGIALIRAAVEGGVTFFDTAEVYGPFTNERLVGEGLGTGRVHALLPVWLQKTWGSWAAYGGGGYGINPGPGLQNYGFIGGVLQDQVAKPVLVGIEVYHQTAAAVGGRDDTAFNVGTVIDLSEMHHLLFSAGRSINGPTDFQCYFAYQLTFDNRVFRFSGHPRP